MPRSSLLILLLALAASYGPAHAQSGAEDAGETPVLTVYTYDAFAADWGPGPLLEKDFEAACACDLRFVAADSSISALRRAQLEGQTTGADVIVGLDISIAAEARATGLFAPHGVDLEGLELPLAWADPLFVPFDYGWFAFVYNREEMPEPPRSFQELAGADDDLKIVIQDPRASTPGLGLLLWVKAAYGDDASEAWAELAPHIVTVTQSWSDSYALFLNGEADMVLSYTTSPSYHLIAEGDARFAAARFQEGHYLQVELAGILASSPHQALARQFLAWLVTPDAQSVIATTNWMFPVNAGAELPEGFAEPLSSGETLLLDDEEVATRSRAWIAEFLEAIR